MNNPFEAWLKPEYLNNLNNLNNMNPASNMQMAGFKDIMESARKSVQAFAEAQQIAVESMQTVMQRQREIISKAMQDNSAILQEIVNEGTPEEKVARGAELIREAYEDAISGMQEVGDICTKSGREACDVIARRITTYLDEVKSTARAAAARNKKAAPAGKKSA